VAEGFRSDKVTEGSRRFSWHHYVIRTQGVENENMKKNIEENRF
jgi:hypothetical protein